MFAEIFRLRIGGLQRGEYFMCGVIANLINHERSGVVWCGGRGGPGAERTCL